MKQILMIVGFVVVAVINFVMYCCFKLASQEDRILEKLSQEGEHKEDDD